MEFSQIIYTYLLDIFLRFKQVEELEEDPEKRQVQIQKHYEAEFFANIPDKKAFKKYCPKPVLKTDNQKRSYELFKPLWVDLCEKQRENRMEGEDSILDSTTGGDFSSVGASVAEQSVAAAAKQEVEPIPEEKE